MIELVEGKIYWTCEPSFECDSNEPLHMPHKVKVKFHQGGGSGFWLGHGFNEETGEIDIDTNATMAATKYNCFLTKKEANDRLARNLSYRAQEAKENLEFFIQTRDDSE